MKDPPDYNDSPSLPSPSYSCELANGEQTLEYTPRPGAARSPSAVFIKESGELSVVLNGQAEDATIPVFGRSAAISGILLCHTPPDRIRKIVLKLEGRLDSKFSAGGNVSTKLINNSYTLWSHLTSQEPCPSQVPFSIKLPSTFQDGNDSFSLPPSYHFFREVVLSLLVRSSYQLHFIVTRVRYEKFQVIWPKEQHVIIPFKYVPRTRAPRPIVATPCFFSTVKTSPEEWHQAVTCLNMRPNATVSPITCNLFIPAGRIYGLTDTINFHVQLAGLTCSLYKLFSGTDLDRITSTDSDGPATKNKPNNEKPLIRVTLLRQVSVRIRGENTSSNSTLGEGTIWPIPPDLSSCCATSGPSQYHEGNIDWEGEVRCQSDVTVGGFHAANVQVKDFIVLFISPPTPKSPLLELKLVVPVRLVTDSFFDITQMDAPLI